MNYQKTTLPNKLRLLVVPMATSESATVTVWVRTGSRFEEERVAGISHFAEHIVFKGSTKRPTSQAIFGAADSLGAEMNAGTEKEWTNYYIKGRAGVLEQMFDILSDMVLNPLLDEKEIEKEKGVIIQEMHLYNDNPTRKIGDVFENVIYQKSSLERDIIGSQKTIKAVTKKDFQDYRRKHYYSENMLIGVAGGVSPDKAKKLAGKYFSALSPGGKQAVKPNEIIRQDGPCVRLKYKKTDQTHLMLGFRGSPIGSKNRYAEAVLTTILTGGASSRINLEIRDKRGLAYAVVPAADHRIDNGYVALYCGLKNEKAFEAIKVMLNEYRGLAMQKKPIGKQEITKAKEFIKGHLALFLEDTAAVNEFFGLKELMLGKTETPEEIYQGIDKVSTEEVYNLAGQYFKSNRLNLAVIGPFQDPEKFLKELK